MTVITADFEKGTNGNSVLAADTGSATAFNAVTVAGGNTVKYDNTHAAHGTLSAKFDNTGNAASSDQVQWTTALGTITEEYGRLYVYMTANPAVQFRLWQDNTNIAQKINVLSGGTVQVLDTGGQVFVTTATVSLNQWIRIEWHVVYSATVGLWELKLYNTPDSTTATETKTSSANRNTGANSSGRNIGLVGGGSTGPLWMDNIVANATAYPGPFPVNTVAPGVTGSTPVGSTLTCDGGTWGGTFTLTYQWTRAGVNIAAATSSTYVTVSADAGHAIGCTVTATGQQATNESASQASSSTVTPVAPPVNTVAPAVTGTAAVGSVLTTTNGTWTDAGSPTFTYQWQRGGSNIGGATASTYTLVDADDATNVRCVVTDTDANGATAANSNAAAVTEPVPTNSVAPAVTGTTALGDTLTSTTGTWTHQGGTVATYTYQWQRDDVNIAAATAATRVIASADQGHNLRCVVTATNTGGAGTPANSNETAVPSAAGTGAAFRILARRRR